MCGIAGIAYFNDKGCPTFEQIKAMCDTIVHRGPDDEGIEVRNGVGLGMRRLSIIDLSGGRQPIYNETNTIRTVFNGEIYNYRTLREELEAKGHVFRTQSDTEVIVHGYEEYGADVARRLNGMFGLAIHDIPGNRLVLMRDHLGIKPLFYFHDKQRIVWGSEIKTILANGDVRRSLDFDAMGDFFAWEYVPGEKTLFRHIRKLPPGALIDIDLNGSAEVVPKIFWDVPVQEEDTTKSRAEWEELIEHQLKKSVRQQLVSDVPLGAFLSGGVDSSLVVAMMENARTFSIGFDDPSYSELPWSTKVAGHLGVEHETEIIVPDIARSFNDLMYFMDDPIGDFSIFPTFLVSRMARQHVTVCLSGDGGDEIFGGYETYLAEKYAHWYKMFPPFLRNGLIHPLLDSLKPRPVKKGLVNKAKRFVEGFREPESLAHARWRMFAGDSWRTALFSDAVLEAFQYSAGEHIERLFAKTKSREPLNRSLYVDLKSYLADNILVKVDRMSMAVSLETRVPYLDKDLVELAFRIPAGYKIEKSETKAILKHIAVKHIPKECVYRAKEGFSIPIKNWLKAELRPLMEDLLSAAMIKKHDLFRPETVERLKNEHMQGKANHSHILWSLMVFQAWHKRWLEV